MYTLHCHPGIDRTWIFPTIVMNTGASLDMSHSICFMMMMMMMMYIYMCIHTRLCLYISIYIHVYTSPTVH